MLDIRTCFLIIRIAEHSVCSFGQSIQIHITKEFDVIFNTKLYPAVNCNPESVEKVFGDEVPDGHFGYVLIDNKPVPFSFIDYVADDVNDRSYPYNAVLSTQDYVSEDLWEALDGNERAVLPGVLMLLIEQGRIAIQFGESEEEMICDECKRKVH